MLSNLHVKNLALMEECDINFTDGLNILSGETGAGKSILIGSINLALGAKADRDMIRHGAEYGLVELVFEKLDEHVFDALKEMDLPVEEDVVIIQRKITPTKSILKINGETVTARQVKTLAETLIDIHGQHEHQSLLKTSKHMEILDSYAGEELLQELQALRNTYNEYVFMKEELETKSLDETARKREIDLLQYEIEEISVADLKIGEDEELEQTFQKMKYALQIKEALHKSVQCVDYENGAGNLVSFALRELKPVISFDKELEELNSILLDVDSMLSDFTRSANRMAEDMDFSEEAFALVEERLNLLNHLKDKYGNTIEDILLYFDKQNERLEELLHYEDFLAGKRRALDACYTRVLEHCDKVTEYRMAAKLKLESILTKALLELNFLDVKFEIALHHKEKPSRTGVEDVEFLISTNPGETLKPMQQVASGGELSRIMLAIKTVLAKKDSIDTLIFDEIDAGISGKTAWCVSEKLGELGKAHQILCITHLPQIAAMADSHYLIFKEVVNGNTITNVESIKEEAQILELARMVGADEVDNSATEHARHMRNQALSHKAKF